MRMIRKSFLVSLAAVGLLLTGTAHAEVQERTIRLPFVQAAEHPHGLGAKRFAELVSEKSGGKMTVKLFPGGTLGGDLQSVSALQGGTLEMTMVSTGLLAGQVKEFAVFDLPFMFEDPREVYAVLDGPMGESLLSKLPEKGLVGLGYWDYGYRHLTNNRRPVTKLEDIQGLKVRVIQIPIFIDLFNTLGANAVPMAFPELYTGLEAGAVDGQENPLSTIVSAKFYEVQKHVALTRHVYNSLAVIFSKKTWDKLSEEERTILQEASAEAKQYEREVSQRQDAEALEFLKKEGVEVTEIAPAEFERMRAAVQPVTEKYTQEIGPELVKAMRAEIEKVRGTLK
jgi:tripartite ATP-independent transporter DctP family solute receptor